ncbi:MAG: S41 family peptidase [Bacteroidota bacterium]
MSKFWQEVNYNFAYLNNIDRDKWESDYKSLIEEVQKTENDFEYYRLLQRFCASLKDGHTNVYLPDTVKRSLLTTNFGEYRLFLQNVENRVIVSRVNSSKKDEIPIGTEIIRVNGTDTESYLKKEVIPYISSSTEHIALDWATMSMFQAPIGISFDITFKLPGGEIKNLHLTHSKTIEKEVYPGFEDWKLFEFKWIDKDIAYVALNSFSNPKINTLFLERLPELYGAKKLIVDLRKNGGGSTYIGRDILQYLTKDTLLYGSKAKSRLHIPSFKAWGEWTEAQDTIGDKWATQEYLSYRDNFFHDFPYKADTIKIEAKRLVIPTVILLGHNTASAAEDFLIYADNQPHMTKIGEPTFGSTGQPLYFELPGGGEARVCTKMDTYPDGKEFVGHGVMPDIEVSRTFEDFIENRDTVLEKAIQYLKEK